MIFHKLQISVLALMATVLLAACTGGDPATPAPFNNVPGANQTPVPTPTPAVNRAPIANPGTTQSVNTNVTVTLDGSASSDPDGDLITYAWTLTSPTGSTATLSNATIAKPTFVPNVAGNYVAQLTVNDGKLSSPTKSVTIMATIGNRAPIANAGSPQTVTAGTLVTLNGTGSSDPDGNTITYAWTLTSRPTGSTTTLSSANTARPTLTPNVAGSYVAQLIVNDGMLNSTASTVTITANPAATPTPSPTPVPTPTPAPTQTCESLKSEFQTTTWNTVLKTSCLNGCHLNATGFPLTAETTAGFNNANFDSFKLEAAKTGVNGLSLMLTKPAGLESFHAGGVAAAQNSAAYNKLADMVAKTKSCTVGTITTTGVVNGSGYYRLRKATLALAGRLPTAAEEAAVNSAGTSDAAITAAINTQLDAMMNTEAGFYTRLKEIYNDMLLTDYYATNGRALNELDFGNFANKAYFDTKNLTNAGHTSADAGILRGRANYGLARAPVELVAYVVANNRPITEIVTADYVMVNSYSAAIFGATVTGDPAFTFKYGDALIAHNPNEFKPAKLTDANNRTYEHAGILSTLPFLYRYPSTSTNRNRARARYAFEFFLDTDVQALADRAALNFDNVIGQFPTMSDPQCSVCHNVVDPVAGLFKNYNNNGVFSGDVTNWYNKRNPKEMLDPGYTINSSDTLPTAQSGKALQFLGARIALDNRFATATVKTLLRGLIGPDAADDTTLVESLKQTLTSNNYNMKTLIKAVVASSQFKAVNLGTNENPANFATLGVPVLSTPEQLDRKVTAITGGYQWKSPSNGTLMNANNYMLLYGGIDSMNVTDRTREPTSIMASIQERIAYQAACSAVPADFAKAAGSRALVPGVAITDLPDNGTGTNRIKQNIQYLHKRILGEELALNDPEITRTYDLFVAAKAKSTGSNIPADCNGALASNDPIRVDANGTVRSWMAVVSYLMMDYKFLFE